MGKRIFDYAVLIASDSRSAGDKEDLCVDAIKKTMPENYRLVQAFIVPDNRKDLEETMVKVADELSIPLLLSSGGTGFGPRDNTPEATLAILDKQTPGISEAIRLISKEKTDFWMLSRAVSGIRKQSLIINLPGSPKAVLESLEGILPVLDHGLEIMLGDFGQHD